MNPIHISGRAIGPGQPVYVIAEISANHNGNFEEALALVRAAKDCGADAAKLQTYTAETLTIDCDNSYFKVSGGTLWDGRTLYGLYAEAHTPWEWQPKLRTAATELGLHLFSTPFDSTAVEFLEAMDVPAHKVASFEIVDIPLLRQVGATRKPVILSTGMASREEIEEAVATLREAGTSEVALLKCTSAYPSPAEDMHLATMSDMAERFNVPVGLSDHTLGIAVPVAAVARGACIVEKHFTMSRAVPGPDSAFSLEPAEFRAMVDAIRIAERAVGTVHYGPVDAERKSTVFRRSLFVVQDIEPGEAFTARNVRSIRPGFGLAPKYLDSVVGKKAAVAVPRGTPLIWEHISE